MPFIKLPLLVTVTLAMPVPWVAAFDMIILVHDSAGYVDGGSGVRQFLLDLFNR